MRQIVFTLLSFCLLFSCKTEEPQTPPVVITSPATEITLSKAKISGEVSNEGFSAASERGFVMSETNPKPSVSDTKHAMGYGKGTFSKELDNLKINTKYYFAAFATNTKGTSYGEILSFTTADYKLAILAMEEPNNITYTTVQLTSTVTEDGGIEVSERGFCLNTTPNPTTSNIKIINGKGLGTFSTVVASLKDETKFYCRSYAINAKGTGYGKEFSFTTLSYTPPVAETSAAISVGNTFSTLTGTISDNGGTELIEKGFILDTSPNTKIDNYKTISSNLQDGTYSIVVKDLKASTKYFFRAYAINKKGTTLGQELSFVTQKATQAIFLTSESSDINQNSGKIGLEISNDGGSSIKEFGICYSSNNFNPTVNDFKFLAGTSVSQFPLISAVTLTGLEKSTTYYYRGYVINGVGISYSEVKSFKTLFNSLVNLKSGLIAYYPFDVDVKDISGNNLNGVSNGLTKTSDRNGSNNAFYFSGNGSYVKIYHNSRFNCKNLTISLWVRPLSFSDGSQRLLVSKREESGWGASFQMGLYNLGFNTFGADWTMNFKNTNFSSNNINLNTGYWYFLTYTHDQTGAKLYLNGLLAASNNTVSNFSFNELPVTIGQRPSGAHPFLGTIDEVGLWDRALSEAEIQYLYQNNYRP